MQRFALVALCGVLLSGCNYTVYHQAGKSVQDRDRDITNCDVQALRDAPVQTQIRYTAPQPRERKICDDKGNCLTETYWTRPEPYTVDINEDLRSRVKAQCIMDQGYSQVSLPMCDNGTSVSVPVTMTGISAKSCVVRVNGKLQVGEPS